MPKGNRRPFPNDTLEEVLKISICIQEQNAGKPMKRLLLADALGRKPTSSDFRDLLSSSYKYGLTEGTEKAEYIQLTDIGTQATRPISEDMKATAITRALLSPELFKRIYTHYKDSKFPSGQFFENTLEREFSVPREYVKELALLLEKNGRFSGIIRDISGSPHVMFDAAPSTQIKEETETQPSHDEQQSPIDGLQTNPPLKQEQRPLFIAHGKNKKPVEQLEKILQKFKIPYKIAVEEPNSGRPIPKKIADLMNLCGSAIFIFSKDKDQSSETEEVHPNPNAIFELGAASVLYGEKIIVFKEDGLKFPSDFDSIGYITFEKDKLESKAMELLNELIAMGFVKITTA